MSVRSTATTDETRRDGDAGASSEAGQARPQAKRSRAKQSATKQNATKQSGGSRKTAAPKRRRLTRKERERIDEVLRILAETYPDAKCALNFRTPFELLVATVLSAQCTDKRVNEVTARIFPRWNKPEHYASLSQHELEEAIRDCGLFRSKSRHLIQLSQQLLTDHDGEVPRRREELEKLPGVGRKTANVVLSNAFGEPAIAVDTHVFRVANRLGLARSNNVLETEKQLMEVIPRELWSPAHHWLIHHGRAICQARRPRCGECPLQELCPSAEVAAAGGAG